MSKKFLQKRIKSILRPSIELYRQSTWTMRALPDFIIIGAQKAGTTSLYSYLSEHPNLVPSFTKEIHYFDGGLNPDIDNYKKGEEWYRSHFPLKYLLGKNKKTYEATPLYLFNPPTPERIHKLIPNVKLIAILRNPTERAISQYFHELKRGREIEPIEVALKIEDKRLDPIITNQDYKNKIFIQNSYKSRGDYSHQIERYLKYFKKENLLILNSDTLFSNPKMVLKCIFEFVDVDPDFEVNNLSPQNIGTNKRKVDPIIYQELNDYFRPLNHKLYDLIDDDFNW